jgi:aminoglycoside 3-N-acetyltransferase I
MQPPRVPGDTDACPFTVQQLTHSDVVHFRELQRVFAEAFDDRDAYLAKPPSDAYVRRWLGSDRVIALTAFAEGTVVAGLVAYVLEKFEQERTEIYIYDLAVAERVRRRGIATALIRALQAIAKVRGAWVIYVQADYGDDPAIRLYESLGQREEVLHFDIPV